ncbi:ATP-binding protein [Paenibacillus sp. J2TS4]|uniref:hybrid sensor histidine kinase/response regulator n=1 Tax=Paenibacillus sp. J2TS4 TaxID=2807194 RepID=UPI0020BFE416|nr:ATP-binding protein [Paenibacillus sp. J2TS4]
MMTKRNIVLITGLFFLILTGIRGAWIMLHMPPKQPQAVQGILDLRTWDFPLDRTFTLNGEWEFYPHELIMQNPLNRSIWLKEKSLEERSFIQVPGQWDTPEHSSIESGSYRLRILLNPEHPEAYGLRIRNIPYSSELFVDGQSLHKTGQPAQTADQYTARNVPYSVFFATDKEEIEIIIHAANFDNPKNTGIRQSIKFGTDAAVNREVSFSMGTQLVMCAILAMHAFYGLILYFIGPRRQGLIFFSLLILCAIMTILVADDRLLLFWVPMNFEWTAKILSLSYLGAAVFLLEFIKKLLPEYSNIRGFRWFTLFCGLFALFFLLLPTQYTMFTSQLRTLLVYLPFLLTWIITLRAALHGDKDILFLLLGATAITTNMGWAVIKGQGWLDLDYYPLDMLATLLALATYWFKRYFRASAQTEELAKKLQQEHKMKDDFLANTSHELRNPLHAILNIAQAMLDSGKSSLLDPNAKNMKLLITIGRRMSFMLNDLLDLTRLKESRIRLQVRSISIQTVVTGVLDMLRLMTEGKSIRLIHNIPDTFPPVRADENRLIQILFNLLHNAVKHTNEGWIAVHASVRDGMAIIEVEDTGIGMDEETQQKVFQPYEQGDSSIAAGGGGLGLGLSICKQLVELQGGTIEVRSIPNQGSVFTFTLPVAESFTMREEPVLTSVPILTDIEAAAAQLSETSEVSGRPERSEGTEGSEPAAPPGLAANSTSPRILAVDDDPINLNILKSILSAEGCELTTATSGKEALSLLNGGDWDLVISDVMMPHMSGYELARRVRQRFSMSELPILLLTARNRAEDIETGFLSGANDHVTKPVEATELRARVRALTELKHSVSDRLRMEAAWLQAQIQPHFMFNTLNAIAALSYIDTPRMRDILEAFGNYLRGSFDSHNSERLVPLKHELELVRSYLFIEKERFEERLQINWEIEESLTISIPPLSIQPLVENAIRHGLMKRSQGGELHIRITDREDHVQILVRDNGIGMDEAALRRILDHSRDRQGIGLRNTDRRLKQIYGKGLQISSSPGQGTTVTFIVTK